MTDGAVGRDYAFAVVFFLLPHGDANQITRCECERGITRDLRHTSTELLCAAAVREGENNSNQHSYKPRQENLQVKSDVRTTINRKVDASVRFVTSVGRFR